jgi:hypothetical protein
MNDLILKVETLAELDRTDSAYVSRPLLAYISKWLAFTNEEKRTTVTDLKTSLTDGLDIDFTGTQWEEEWLANGKVCKCKACDAARECLQIIEEIHA